MNTPSIGCAPSATAELAIDIAALRTRVLALNNDLNAVQVAALNTASFLTSRMTALCPDSGQQTSPIRAQVIARDIAELERVWARLDKSICADVIGIL